MTSLSTAYIASTLGKYALSLGDAVASLSLMPQLEAIVSFAEDLMAVRQRNAHVYVCGNGGSCANAAHLVLHLRDVSIKAHDLMADAPWLTAIANDHAYEQAFQRSLQVLGAGPEDLLIVISGSGNSRNIIQALAYAVEHSIPRWGLLGMGGGDAKALCGGAVIVDSDDYGVIEDLHSVCIHGLHKVLTDS